MSFYPTLVEPASSDRSSCHTCQKAIAKGQLRAQVRDDSEFKKWLKDNPGPHVGEGFSRGYIETEDGVISIKKYFVHLECYVPNHPVEKQYFSCKKFRGTNKADFDAWLAANQGNRLNNDAQMSPSSGKRKKAEVSGGNASKKKRA